MTSSEFNNESPQERLEAKENKDSPFQDEALFSEEETTHALKALESRLIGYEDESPFLQAFEYEHTQLYEPQQEESEPHYAEQEEPESLTDWDEHYEPDMEAENSEEFADYMEEPNQESETEGCNCIRASMTRTSEHEATGVLDEEYQADLEQGLVDQSASEWDSELEQDSDTLSAEQDYYGETFNELDLYPASENDLERIPPEYEFELSDLLTEETRIDPNDVRIDVRAKFALQRMLKRPDTSADATRLIEAINNGRLAGIYGDDLRATVKVAEQHNTKRWLLVPKGEDAALVLDPTNPLSIPPTIIFRGDTPDISKQPQRLDNALQKAGQTFLLWQSGKLSRCQAVDGPWFARPINKTPAINVVPSGYCKGQLVTPATPPKLPPWIQPCLNKVLGINLPTTGVLDVSTRSALQSFRRRQGLAEVEFEGNSASQEIDSATRQALKDICDQPGVPPDGSIFRDPGTWWQSQAALEKSLPTIANNRSKIFVRFFKPKGPGHMYHSLQERTYGNAEQKALATDYSNWVKLIPKKTSKQWELWEDLMEGEGDYSAVNTYDDMVLTWGVGFAGGGYLEKWMRKLLVQSPAAGEAFLYCGIRLSEDNRLCVVDVDRKRVEEDVRSNQKNKLKSAPYARQAIQGDKSLQLQSLFVNVAQGVGFSSKDIAAKTKQSVVDSQFETFLQMDTGNLPHEVLNDTKWDRKTIAVAGHNIHAGGRRARPGNPPLSLTWNNFKGLVDKSLRGVVAKLGLFFGDPGANGSILVAAGFTSKRIMTLGRGWGRPALSELGGPYAIVNRSGIALPSTDVMLDPPAEFGSGQPAWRSDYVYFAAPHKDKDAEIVRQRHWGEPNLRIFYLVRKDWAATS